MPAVFDPYHKWLGILPKDQPPHHYRLLGLEPFEDDVQVIETAANRQLGFLRGYQSGEYAAQCQQLLNEVTRARLCLLKPTSKTAYDAKLQAKLEESSLNTAQESSESQFDLRAMGWPLPAMIGGVLVLVFLASMLFFLGRGKGQRDVDAAHQDVGVANAIVPGVSVPNGVPTVEPNSNNKVTKKADANGLTDIIPLLAAEHIVKVRWKFEKDRVESITAEPQAQFVLPVDVPKEYTLHIEAIRLDTPESEFHTFGIGLVCGPNDCMFVMETHPPRGISGLQDIDDRRWDKNETTLHQMHTQIGKRFLLDAIVRVSNIEIRVDDRTIVDWNGDFTRLHRVGSWELNQPHRLFVGADSKYRITKITLGPPLPRRKLPIQDVNAKR
ncbi:MAG: hypothetical protein JWM11_4059 [Planctomycetaceae bacterium]|nr:hypothetical protein [Planctomycetaceae bacterium]